MYSKGVIIVQRERDGTRQREENLLIEGPGARGCASECIMNRECTSAGSIFTRAKSARCPPSPSCAPRQVHLASLSHICIRSHLPPRNDSRFPPAYHSSGSYPLNSVSLPYFPGNGRHPHHQPTPRLRPARDRRPLRPRPAGPARSHRPEPGVGGAVGRRRGRGCGRRGGGQAGRSSKADEAVGAGPVPVGAGWGAGESAEFYASLAREGHTSRHQPRQVRRK